MARHEGNFRFDSEEPLGLDDLLNLLGANGEAGQRSRDIAIACYLSGAEGWREAVKILGGAFAGGEGELKEGKAD